jgi:hypothetical protein
VIKYLWNFEPTILDVFKNEVFAVLVEGCCSNEKFIEDAPECPYVRSIVAGFMLQEFW